MPLEGLFDLERDAPPQAWRCRHAAGAGVRRIDQRRRATADDDDVAVAARLRRRLPLRIGERLVTCADAPRRRRHAAAPRTGSA